MATQLKDKIREILAASFPGIVIDELEKPSAEGRLTGVLVWKGFEGKEQVERQKQVWDVLRSELTKKEQGSISMIITLTPRELKSIRAA
jgi:stress-induced morphogen